MNLVFSTRLPRLALAALALVGAVIAAPQASMAASVSFDAPNVTVAESATAQTVSADITISDSVATDILAGYQLDLFVSSTPGNVSNPADLPANLLETAVTITGFTLGTTGEQYVYNSTTAAAGNADVNNSNDVNFASPGYLSNFTTGDGATVASEIYNNDGYANTDVATLNATYGLANVQFTIAAGYSGTVYLVWNNDGIANDSFAPFYELSGNPVNPIDPNLVTGSIVVTAIPEPASVVLMLFGAIGLIGYGLRRARKA
jgi:hypothetical protein